MWLLWILFVDLAGHNAVLAHFDTKGACDIERDRIAVEMEHAYPGDVGFQIVCRYQAVRSRPIPAIHQGGSR